MTHVFAIAGGSGSGKSTLAYALQDKHPGLVTLLHLDDYQKRGSEIRAQKIPNRDHPRAVNFSTLYQDIQQLKKGETITVNSFDDRLNPDHKQHGRKDVFVQPRKYLIIEGYLALHDEKARKLYDKSLFLDLDHLTRMQRRTKMLPDEYKDILKEMHEVFVEPTKRYSGKVIDVSQRTEHEVFVHAQKYFCIH